MLEFSIHSFSPEYQLLLLPLIWGLVPALFILIARQGLCAPAKGWWVISLGVYVVWLAFNNPIVSSLV